MSWKESYCKEFKKKIKFGFFLGLKNGISATFPMLVYVSRKFSPKFQEKNPISKKKFGGLGLLFYFIEYLFAAV